MRGFVFPGQGSQQVGMGQELAEAESVAREVFDEADEALGESLSGLCWGGPESDLQLTANTQPAILTTSVAALRVLQQAGHEPQVVAGHSLGEYSALVACGSLAFADAVRLVRRRGQLMQEAVPVGVGAMAAILGLDDAAVRNVVDASRGDEVLDVANLNAPGQTVIAGHASAVERANEKAQEAGARRAVLLPVSAPFHCPLMQPAREGLLPMLEATEFADPRVPIVVNVDAAPVKTGDEARDALVRQIESPVRWVESIEHIVEQGTTDFVEVGPGGVLRGLIRRIHKGAKVLPMSAPADLEKIAG
ncbi:MAG: ACP S-malonyltransferase [Acidobacteriota bacterium]